MEFREAIKPFSEEPLTCQLLLHVLSGYKRPFDKIGELVKQEFLTPVKRSMFEPGTSLKMTRPDPLLVANIICDSSYVSLESALWY